MSDKVLMMRNGKTVWAPAPKIELPEGYPYKEGSKTVIEWDGNTEGLDNIGGRFFLVSPAILSNDEIKNGVVTGSDGFQWIMAEHWDTYVSVGYVAEDYVMVADGFVIFVRKAGAEIMGAAIEKPGVYFMNMNGNYITSFTTETETIHTMAPEFLPAGVGGGEQNAYIITATPEGSGFVCSHTYDEIMELVNNNFFVVMKINFYGTPAYFNMVYALNGEACFSGFVKMYGSGNLNVYDAYVSTDGVHLEGNPVVLAGLVLSDADNKQYKISVVDGSLTATAL